MQKISCTIDSWEICGFDPSSYERSALLSGQYDKDKWIKTCRPEDVHSILIKNDRIPHPHYKANDLDCLWVEKKLWVYRTQFEITEDMLDGHLFLNFEGLDTYVNVIINGNIHAVFDNMLVEHELEITDKVMEGSNSIVLEFDVAQRRASSKSLPEGFWINYSTERAYARKAAYHYGWDWTSRIATVGIWKPVRLVYHKLARINSVHIVASDISVSDKKATLSIDIDSTTWSKENESYKIMIISPSGEEQTFVTGDKSITIKMDKVDLWWTHDLGKPNLYQIDVTMLCGDEEADKYTCEYGIRKLNLRLYDEDKKEKRFLFELNDIPLMSRGANWVPVSNFLSTAEDERYIKLIHMAKQANMNMLSIWGGGIYEKDIFYETCDREGILLWQYFMFSCGEYPDYDEEYVSGVKEEVKKAVTRLRNHTCIALWIGNVEGQMISEKINLPREMYGSRLFNEYIPNWLKELDTTRHYLPSSPWSEEGPANSMESGDRHNWDVWFTDVKYTHYAEDSTRFASEFGIHSAPVRQTISRYIGEENAKLDNFYFKYINKDQSLGRMLYYMDQHIGRPKNLDEYIDFSMYVQAEGLKYAVQHYRRNFPATSGALIWQLNDCMPVHSWSMIDYDLIPKASYYYARDFFAPAIISLEEIDDSLTGIWINNNLNTNIHESLRIEVKDFLGNSFYSEDLDIDVPANTVLKVKELRVGGRFYPNVIIPNRHRMFYLTAKSSSLTRQIRLFGSYQDISLPHADIDAEYVNDTIRIHTDYYARFVKIDGDLNGLELSDNYFDMEPGETKIIKVKGNRGRLYVKALNSKAVEIK